MRVIPIVALVLLLAGCTDTDYSWAWGSSRAWRAVNADGVPVSEARAQCDADAQRATATISNLGRRVSEQRRYSDDCLVSRGY